MDHRSNDIQLSTYYPEWQNNRIKFILTKYEENFFKSKKILELGSCNGYIGSYFQKKLGADVLSVEGRSSNINFIRNDYPDLNVIQADLDNHQWQFGKFDIIINFGLYYHLQKYHLQHLQNCLDNCDLMFFETVVFDSDKTCLHFREEAGDDQSLSGIGGIPSTSYVEQILIDKNLKFRKYSDKVLNGENHHYDWKDKNTEILDIFARRFWIIEKNNF